MKNKNKIKKITIGVIIFTVFSKIFGFLRDFTLGYYYGSSSISDAYILATTLPITIFAFILDGIGASFIPACSRLKKGEENNLTSNMINLFFIITAILILIVEIIPSFFIRILASGIDIETMRMAIDLLRISILGVFFSVITFIFSYYLNYKGSFFIATIRAIPMDIIVIISIIVSAKTHSIIPLALGIPISLLAETIILIPAVLKKGFKYKTVINIKDPNLKNIIMWSLPIIAASAIADLNTIVDRQFASYFFNGAISVLTYSSRTINIIRTALFIPIITVLFPFFSKNFVNERKEENNRMFVKAIETVTVLAIPISFGMFLFSEEIITILFKRGAFNQEVVLNTSLCLKYYTIGIIGQAILAVTTKVFHAMADMKTPMKVALIGLITNILANLIFSKIFGIIGLPIATSVSSIVMAVIEMIILRKKLNYKTNTMIKTGIKTLLGSTVMIVCAFHFNQLLYTKIDSLIGNFAITVLISIIIYGLLLYMLKCSIVYEVFKKVKKVDVLIIIEHKVRELESACLLKYALEKNNYKIKIESIYPNKENLPIKYNAQFVIIPWAYDNRDMRYFKCFLKNNPNTIFINLHHEQYSGQDDKNICLPKGEARDILHVSWGKKFSKGLQNVGCEKESIIEAGNIKLDFYRKQLRKYFFTKEELEKEFNIDSKKKWFLYIANGFHLMNSQKIEHIKKDDENIEEKIEIAIKNRESFLSFVDMWLKNNKNEIFIYRPHPVYCELELKEEKIKKLLEKYPENFYVISELAIGNWIVNSDACISFHSTTIAECYHSETPYYLFRTEFLRKELDYPFFIDYKNTIKNYKDFEEALTERKINYNELKPLIDNYYGNNQDYTYKTIVDKIDKINSYNNKLKVTYKDLFKNNVKNNVKSIIILSSKVPIIRKIFLKIKDNRIDRIISNKQDFITEEEVEEIEKKIKKILEN